MERRAISVQGIVQGVGFRPFVHRLASRFELSGFVRNGNEGVRIEVEGESGRLDAFVTALTSRPPPLARIDRVISQKWAPLGERGFRIEASRSDATACVFVSADVATCEECVAEMGTPGDRRYRYPFLNCTNCGPRLTVVRNAPYDRERTTMAVFSLCPECRAEYENPLDRRFHAEPTACPACGPKLSLRDAAFEEIPTESVTGEISKAAAFLREGRIVAIKGLGGYHLACDGTSARAVAELRRRKHRDAKAFAVMVADEDRAFRLVELSPAERELLVSRRRPIVLARRREGSLVAPDVAPGNPYLGIMLPYTPLHHLLMEEVDLPLVMTSGNRSDEPIAHTEKDAAERLRGIADWFLTHDRAIQVRCDDSVTRIIDGREALVRRSRGYAPEPVPLPFACPVPLLAVGGQYKGVFSLGRDRHAFLSHHLGDLDNLRAYRSFVDDLVLYEKLFETVPEAVAYDLHPDYASTRYALSLALNKRVGVQHHHAHMASVMAEHGIEGKAIGVCFDGTGYGMDGAIWGGEFLVGDYRSVARAAHLRYVGMPGVAKAIREPWRMAAAHVIDSGISAPELEARHAGEWETTRRLLEKRLFSPPTSSMGRLFDAVAAITGIRDIASYEGQAAMELEWAATNVPRSGRYPFALVEEADGLVVDTRPTIEAISADREGTQKVARRFHSTVVEIVVAVCRRLREAHGARQVCLGGGVFMNRILLEETRAALSNAGFSVYRNIKVPANDGGLSFGQLAVAAAVLEEGADRVSWDSR